MKCLWQLPEQVRIREKKKIVPDWKKNIKAKIVVGFCFCFVLALKLSEYCINIQVHFISKDAHLYKSTIEWKFCAIFETEESLKWPNSGQQLICKKRSSNKEKKIIIKQCLFIQLSWGISSVLKQTRPGFWLWMPFINFVSSLTCPEIMFSLFPIVKRN